MGAEGYIELSRIGDGVHLLRLDDDPVFIVGEPVVVLPARPQRMGRWTNLRLDGYEALESQVAFEGATCIPLTSQGELLIGVCVLEHQYYFGLTFPKLWEAWEKGPDTPGMIPFGELKEAWEKIRPGYWAVTSYYGCGVGDNHNFSFRLPKGCEVTETVKWMFWT